MMKATQRTVPNKNGFFFTFEFFNYMHMSIGTSVNRNLTRQLLFPLTCSFQKEIRILAFRGLEKFDNSFITNSFLTGCFLMHLVIDAR